MSRPKRSVTDLLRLQVAARDGVICQYCGDSTAGVYQVDHLVPITLGGPCALHNLVMACQACNERKKDAVWVPWNLDRLIDDDPAWRAYVLSLAARSEQGRPPVKIGNGTPRVAETLTPAQEYTVAFCGDQLLVVQATDGGLYVPLRPIANLLGLAWHGQFERLQRNSALWTAVRYIQLPRATLGNSLVCLPFELFPGWLFGISVKRISPAAQEKVDCYRRRCQQLLAQALQSEAQFAV